MFIEPRSPWEGEYIELFNVLLGNELLNEEIFDVILGVKVITETGENITINLNGTVHFAIDLMHGRQY